MNDKNFKKKITFAVDLDEVLRCTLCRMIEIYNKYFDDNKQYDDVTSFVCEQSFPRIERETGFKAGEWFFQLHSKEIFEDTEPIEGALEAFKELQNYGRVIVVTYQKTIENKIQALKWLEKWGFPVNEICFLKDKTLLHTDYLVDDNDWNFIGSNVKYGILINAPYNYNKSEKEIEKNTNGSTIIKMENLAEFVEKIREDFK